MKIVCRVMVFIEFEHINYCLPVMSRNVLQVTGISRTQNLPLILMHLLVKIASALYVVKLGLWLFIIALRPFSFALLLAFCSFVGNRLYKACPWKAEAVKRFKTNLFEDKEGIEENCGEGLKGFCTATEPCLCKTQSASEFQQAAKKQAKRRPSKTLFPSSEVCHLDRGWLEGSWNI